MTVSGDAHLPSPFLPRLRHGWLLALGSGLEKSSSPVLVSEKDFLGFSHLAKSITQSDSRHANSGFSFTYKARTVT